jgi:uncharacterized protein
MSANLTPQYKQAEERFRTAASHDAKLEALREMLALLPKHKGTEKMYADLKKRLSRLEDEGDPHTHKGARHDEPGHVHREGAGQWALIGPPNAGKSALLRSLTHAHPEVAPYPFTTRVPLAGMMPFEDVQVQLVDTPAVSETHTEAWLTNLVRNADGLLVVLDPGDDALASSMAAVRAQLERARVWPRCAPPSDGEHPFALVRPVRIALNKSDADADGTLRALARESLPALWPVHEVSAEHGGGLEDLRHALWSDLERIRIYAKEPGKKADNVRPFVLARGATVHDLATVVHKDIAERLKFARIWGHAAFDGQQVDRHHALDDRDVVELHA